MKGTILALGICLALSPAHLAQNADAADIIAKMARRYAECRTYQDSGVEQLIVDGRTIPHPTPFKIYFFRQDHYRFEWITTQDMAEDGETPKLSRSLNAVSSSPGGVFEYQNGELAEPSRIPGLPPADGSTVLQLAGRFLAGQTVPSMLTQKVPATPFTKLKAVELLEDAAFEGIACFRLRGTAVKPNDTELWIGKEDLLLRKRRTTFGSPGAIVEEVHRDIRMNEPIPLAAFPDPPPKRPDGKR